MRYAIYISITLNSSNLGQGCRLLQGEKKVHLVVHSSFWFSLWRYIPMIWAKEMFNPTIGDHVEGAVPRTAVLLICRSFIWPASASIICPSQEFFFVLISLLCDCVYRDLCIFIVFQEDLLI